MPEDVTRLPKWAQLRLQKLEADLASAKRTLDQMQSFDGSGKVVLEGFNVDDDKPLPDRSSVRFTFGNRCYLSVRFLSDDRLNVNCGFGDVLIRPQASNSFDIEVRE